VDCLDRNSLVINQFRRFAVLAAKPQTLKFSGSGMDIQGEERAATDHVVGTFPPCFLCRGLLD
jgi:hypothetical protein